MDDPILAFLQRIGTGAPGNGLPGGGVNGLRASTPGGPGLPILGDPRAASPPYSISPDFGPVGPLTAGWMHHFLSGPQIDPMAGTDANPLRAGDPIQTAGPPASGLQSYLTVNPPSPVQGPLAMPARPTSAGRMYSQMSPTLAPPPQGGPYVGSGSPVQGPLGYQPGMHEITPPQGGPYVGSGPPPRSPTAPQSAGPVMPPPRPASSPVPGKKRIDPAAVDLGKVPRFTTVQYQVPNGNQYPLNGISRSRAPIYTALNLGGK